MVAFARGLAVIGCEYGIAAHLVSHVGGESDGARVLRHGAIDGLPDPPGGVGGELEALAVVELLHRPHEPEVPLLDKISQKYSGSHVALAILTTRRRLARMRWTRASSPRHCPLQLATTERVLLSEKRSPSRCRRASCPRRISRPSSAPGRRSAGARGLSRPGTWREDRRRLDCPLRRVVLDLRGQYSLSCLQPAAGRSVGDFSLPGCGEQRRTGNSRIWFRLCAGKGLYAPALRSPWAVSRIPPP